MKSCSIDNLVIHFHFLQQICEESNMDVSPFQMLFFLQIIDITYFYQHVPISYDLLSRHGWREDILLARLTSSLTCEMPWRDSCAIIQQES
jgi:hypothetical protein